MANKMIQLNDGTDNVYPEVYVNSGSNQYTAVADTYTLAATVAMPSGTKIVSCYARGSHGRPVGIAITAEDNGYTLLCAKTEQDDALSAHGIGTTTVTNQDEVKFYVKHADTGGSNHIFGEYAVLSV